MADAYERIIAIVVHLGVEFKETDIDEFDEEKVQSLVAAMKDNKQIAFEGHSTDYQTKTNLSTPTTTNDIITQTTTRMESTRKIE